MKFYNNFVTGSSTQCFGGAIYINNSTVNINKSSFWKNYVKKFSNVIGLVVDGGAIYSNSSTLTITNTTFYNNTEVENYGATYTNHVHNQDGTLSTINAIFEDGGLYNYGTGTANLSYSYYHGSLPTGTANGGNNILSSSGSYINPGFVDANNGNFDLLGISPCLDAGDQINGKNIGYYQGNGITPPIITISVPTVGFEKIPTGTTSEEKSYTVSGSNLTNDLLIYAPEGYQITLTSGDYSGLTNEINLIPVDGVVSETTIYVRFSPTSASTYNYNITHISAGAENKFLSLTGEGGLLPTILFNFSVNPFGQHYVNSPSYSEEYYVYGYNYYDDLYIVAPDGFEISFDSNFEGQTDTLTITPDVNGDVPWTKIKVRFNPSEIKEYTDSILHFTKYVQDTAVMHVSGTGIEPPSLTINPSSLDFGNLYIGEYSKELSFRITGSNIDQLVLNNNYDVEMTLTSGNYSGDLGYISINANGDFDTTVYVRFRSNNLGTFNSSININAGGINKVCNITGNIIEANTPLISVNPTNISFGSVLPGEHSNEYVFSVTGYNLVGDITIDAPDNFDITEISGDYSGNTSTITLTPTSGIVNNKVVYVRFSPTSQGYFSNFISLSSPNALITKVFTSGTGVDNSANPSISFSEESINFGQVAINTTSTIKSFNVLGQNLSNDIILTTPTPFEISINGEDFFGDGSPISIPVPEGENSVAATIYVRFMPNEIGEFGGSILASSESIQQFLSLYGTGIEGTTGIGNLSTISVSVYPNPTSNSLYIITENNEKINHVIIYNAIGGVIKQFTEMKTNQPLDLSDLTKGVYFIQLKFGNGFKTIKIVKQ